MSLLIKKKRTGEIPKEEKFEILEEYSSGMTIEEIASKRKLKRDYIRDIISRTTNSLVVMEETNRLLKRGGKTPLTVKTNHAITQDFLDLIETNSELYAYYYAQTNDNKFALKESGLDVGIPKNLKKVTRDYILKIRGVFLRDIPDVKMMVRAEQDKRINEYELQKPQVQMELVAQIEQLKEIARDDPRQRGHLIKAIELLGRTIGAFQDSIRVEETDAKSGLDLIMEKVQEEYRVSGKDKTGDAE